MDLHEVVVHDVAAGALQGLDQPERRLLAEGAGEQHAGLVERLARRRRPGPARGSSRKSARRLLDRQHQGRAQHQVQLVGRHLPGLPAAQLVQLAHQPAVLVVERDRAPQGLGRRAAGAALPQVGGELLQSSLAVERAAQLADRSPGAGRGSATSLSGEQHLPHAREVADHVADGREQHAVEAVEAAVQPQLDGAARDVADVGLVVGVALDDLEVVARRP